MRIKVGTRLVPITERGCRKNRGAVSAKMSKYIQVNGILGVGKLR